MHVHAQGESLLSARTSATPPSGGVRALWPHQRDAVDAAVKTLIDTPRATVVAACGSGKTTIGGQISAEVIPPGGRLLFAAPSLELIGQTLREYRLGARRPGRVIAVCSDRNAVHQSRVDLTAEHAEVTTDPRRLAAALAEPGAATVACTYQSLVVLRDAHARHGLAPWDLVIADEAHRTAGTRGKPWAMIHDDTAIPAHRRLYLSATPRLYDGEDEQAASMDDEALFGPVAYRLPFAEAIERGLLADYRVLVPVITDGEILRLVDGARDGAPMLSSGSSALDPRMLATQVALLRAAAQYGAKRMITYHRLVAEAHAFARTLHAAVDLLEPAERPGALTCLAVDGRQDVHERRPVLAKLGSPTEDTVIVANARVLGEGVDIPAVDAVAFLTPRDSPETTARAVGRALRRGESPDKIATIIIPVVLGPAETPQSALEGSAYAPVWRAIRALRAHDERLARGLDALRFEVGRAAYEPRPQQMRMPEWIRFTGCPVPPGFAAAIALRLVQESAPGWEEMYGRAAAHLARHGHLVPNTRTEPELSQWVRHQRKAWTSSALSADRVERLDTLGFSWTPLEEKWQRGMAAARVFHREHGHPDVAGPVTVGDPPFRLGQWLANIRQKHKNGALLAARIAELDALGMDWSPREGAWSQALVVACDYHERNGHLNPPEHLMWGQPPFALGRWVAHARADRAAGRLSTERIAQLDALGISWQPAEEHWAERFEALRTYLSEHDGCLPEGDDALSLWLASQRKHHRDATLPPERVAQLQQLLGEEWAELADADGAWTGRFEQLRAYISSHDGATPVAGTDRVLARWLSSQRNRQRNRGGLQPERAALLEDLLGPHWAGQVGEADEERWKAQLEALRAYLRAHDGALPGDKDDPDLVKWLRRQRRQQLERGGLKPERAALVEQLLGPHWAKTPSRDEAWTARLEKLREHVRSHDGAAPTAGTDAELFRWLSGQRRQHLRRGGLQPERAALLADLLGPHWAAESDAAAQAYWNTQVEQLRDHLRRHGGAPPSAASNENLLRWVSAQRRAHGLAELDSEQRAQLDQLLGPHWTRGAETRRADDE
jgi:superfamily II DNA or RNA helicase